MIKQSREARICVDAGLASLFMSFALVALDRLAYNRVEANPFHLFPLLYFAQEKDICFLRKRKEILSILISMISSRYSASGSAWESDVAKVFSGGSLATLYVKTNQSEL